MTMKRLLLNGQLRDLAQRETLSITETHTVWRLESGALRIDSRGADGTEMLVRLALPGDPVGIESLLGVKDPFTVRALTPSRLLPLDLVEGELPQLLMDSVITGYQRSRQMVQLRTGSAEERVKSLLVMLAEAGPGVKNGGATCALPTLADIAGIVHTAPETVSRVLTSLRQASFLQDCSPQTAKHKKLEHRTHRLFTRSTTTPVPAVAHRIASGLPIAFLQPASRA
jgi:CRP-like cAMP-binding protein